MIKLEFINLLNSVNTYGELKEKLLEKIPDIKFKEYDNLVLIVVYILSFAFFRVVTRECLLQHNRGNWFLFSNKTEY